jgi:hypothetical protein
MVYQFNSVARIKADAQKAGEQFEELERTCGLTPKNVVDANRAENAPLHNEFEWDDSIAAESYREEQARYIIRMLQVKPEEKKEIPIRAYFSIETANTYENIATIQASKEKLDYLYEQALKELKAFQRKYSKITKLKPIFDEIDKL